jgi:hypothetical protein
MVAWLEETNEINETKRGRNEGKNQNIKNQSPEEK